jgi:hypothetical protein
MKDDAPFVFAGLWEGWKDPATEQWLRTCTIITGEPNELIFLVPDALKSFPVPCAETASHDDADSRDSGIPGRKSSSRPAVH